MINFFIKVDFLSPIELEFVDSIPKLFRALLTVGHE